MGHASPNARRCEAGVREDHQIEILAHSTFTDKDRSADAGLCNGDEAPMVLKDPYKTGAEYPLLRDDQNVLNCCTSYKKPVASIRHRLLKPMNVLSASKSHHLFGYL